jgi:transposase-like protein
MTADTPEKFQGPVEMDETYIGGQRKNKRLHIRRIKTKRGHGTDKLPIMGIFDRYGGQVYVEVMTKKLSMEHIFKIMDRQVTPGASVFTDGYKMYRGLKKKGFRHEYVDHDGGEYVRNSIHTNNIEGFWGILKRKLSCIGGMRRDRLYLFVGEIVWKFNLYWTPKFGQVYKMV